MSGLLKLLPLAALGYVSYENSDVLMKNFDLIGKIQVEVTTGIEMEGIARAVVMEHLESNTLPLNNFSEFLVQNMRVASSRVKRDRSKDMWGTRYRIARVRDGFEIQCAGPDKKWGTMDDIKVFHSLEQYGGVGEADIATPQTSSTSSSTMSPKPASPPPPPVHQGYQWKRG